MIDAERLLVLYCIREILAYTGKELSYEKNDQKDYYRCAGCTYAAAADNARHSIRRSIHHL